MSAQTLKAALVGYGMFGSDVVAGTLWDLQRNGISPYLDRIGLDDRARDYRDVGFELVAVAPALREGGARCAGQQDYQVTDDGFHGPTFN